MYWNINTNNTEDIANGLTLTWDVLKLCMTGAPHL